MHYNLIKEYMLKFSLKNNKISVDPGQPVRLTIVDKKSALWENGRLWNIPILTKTR